MTDELYAVITGDVVDFTKIPPDQQDRLIAGLKDSFKTIQHLSEQPARISFDIFRGDSFQGILPEPAFSLKAVLTIRSIIRALQPEGSDISWDVRMGVGIGSVDTLPERPTEGDGEAFRRSGPAMDKLKKQRKLLFSTPWTALDEEINVSAALLDAVIAKWSTKQAEIVLELLKNKSRKDIAKLFGISETAISYRVQGAGWFAIEQLLHRFQNLVKEKIE